MLHIYGPEMSYNNQVYHELFTLSKTQCSGVLLFETSAASPPLKSCCCALRAGQLYIYELWYNCALLDAISALSLAQVI
jgi:hypothetical protein